MATHEFTLRTPPAFVANLQASPRDGHKRASARVADKYLSRDGAARDPGATLRAQADEVQSLEFAMEHLRRGLGDSPKGRAARAALQTIEQVLIRDYGLYERIRPANR